MAGRRRKEWSLSRWPVPGRKRQRGTHVSADPVAAGETSRSFPLLKAGGWLWRNPRFALSSSWFSGKGRVDDEQANLWSAQPAPAVADADGTGVGGEVRRVRQSARGGHCRPGDATSE